MKKFMLLLLISTLALSLSACGKDEIPEGDFEEPSIYVAKDDDAASIDFHTSDYGESTEYNAFISDWNTQNELNYQADAHLDFVPDVDTGEVNDYIPQDYEVDLNQTYVDNGFDASLLDKFTLDFNDKSFGIFNHYYSSNDNTVVSTYSVLNSMTPLLMGASDTNDYMTRLELSKWFEQGDNILPDYIVKTMKTLDSKFMTQSEFLFNNLIGTKCVFYDNFKSGVQSLNTLNTYIDSENSNPYDYLNQYFNDVSSHIVFNDEYSIDNTYVASIGMLNVEWENPGDYYITDHEFNTLSGNSVPAYFMHFQEELEYIESEQAIGCVKPFNYGHYSFVTILPKDGVDFNTYVESFGTEEFNTLLSSRTMKDVDLYIPRFHVSNEIVLNDMLTSEGLGGLFTNDTKYYLYTPDDMQVNYVLHNSYLSINARGAKSYDDTRKQVTMDSIESVGSKILCDRPFIYVVIDNDTNTPIMMGSTITINDIQANE